MSQGGYSLLIRPELDVGSAYLFDQVVGDAQQVYLGYHWMKKDVRRVSLYLALGADMSAVSLPKTPFGGIVVFGKIQSQALDDFICEVLADLKSRGIQTVRMVQRPRPYEKYAPLVDYLLHRRGFQLEKVWSHQFFLGKKEITRWVKEQGAGFEKKVKKQGLTVSMGPIRNFEFLGKIDEWNRQRGYSITTDQNSIVQQVSLFPDRYYSILLYQGQELVAAALAVRLLPKSLYYFKSGIDPNTHLKPLGDILLHQLFALGRDLEVNFIDLGSSDLESGANHQLMFFKSRFSNELFTKNCWALHTMP